MPKPQVAFFDFTSCEGCQLCVLDLTPTELLELLELIDIVEFREALSEQATTYDIAIVEGSITRDSDIPRLKQIRATAKTLIALGACAAIGGINALKNFQTPKSYQRAVYGNASYESTTAKALHEIVTVDAVIPGCPIDTHEFIRILKNLLLGKKPEIPTYPVCVECKLRENVCVYEQGIPCLGPITRAGCNARCPSNGGYCFGCRGMIPNPNLASQQEILQKYQLNPTEILSKFQLFFARSSEVFHEPNQD